MHTNSLFNPFLVLPNGHIVFFFGLSMSIKRLSCLIDGRWVCFDGIPIGNFHGTLKHIQSPLTYLPINLPFPSAPHDTIISKASRELNSSQRGHWIRTKESFLFGRLYPQNCELIINPLCTKNSREGNLNFQIPPKKMT